GWHKERVENFTALLEGRPVPVDLVDDGWTKTMFATMRQVGPGMTPSDMRDLMQLADFRMMNAVRARVDAIVQDKETAERLKPWYNRMCKRPCFHDAYLQTFNRPNVTLVDTEGYGVDEVTETAVVVRGKSYELDCLIFATGFELGALTRHQAFPIKGRGGHLLSEKWKDGATTLHGMQVSGFPNFFLQGTTQSAWGANFVHMLGIQAEHIAHILGEVRSRGRTVVEATPAAEAAWVGVHESYGERMKNTWSECTPGFFNNEGDYSQIVVRNGGFGGGVTMLSEMLKAWRDDGRLEGLTLS
ncbi:MAG: monooxygenase, partial [Caulobacterales bacterium]